MPLLGAAVAELPGAGVTVAALRVPKEQANQFGVIEAAPGSSRIAQFLVVDFISLELALHDLARAEENVIRTHKMVHGNHNPGK